MKIIIYKKGKKKKNETFSNYIERIAKIEEANKENRLEIGEGTVFIE